MKDLIDREKAIDRILEVYPWLDPMGVIWTLSDIESEDVPHWIPCDKKLPDKEGRYLCSVGSQHRTQREMIYAPETWKHDDCNLWRSTDGTYCHNWFVVAWMPMPEAYNN